MAEPRWLDPDATAAYLSVRPSALARLQKEGRIPAPSYALGPRRPRWDRLALDSNFDGGTASTDIDKVVSAHVQEILRKGRTRRAQKPR